MTTVLIDDQLLGRTLRGSPPPQIAAATKVFTSGYWYVRLCQALLGAAHRPGVLSGPFLELPPPLRERAIKAVVELPRQVGLISLRDLGPTIGELRRRHSLNILGMEVLAAAKVLGCDVFLATHSPRLEAALEAEGLHAELVG